MADPRIKSPGKALKERAASPAASYPPSPVVGYRGGVLPDMVSGMTRLLRIAAVAVLVGGATAVLSSCTGDPGPIVTQTPSLTATAEPVTPSASPAPSVTPEEELLAMIPENARGEDFQSATQFAKFFVQLYPDLFKKGDPQLFRALSTPSCEFCASALETYDAFIASGNSYAGGDIETPDVVQFTGGLQPDGTWLVQFPMDIASSTTTTADGSSVGTIEAASLRTAVALEFTEGHWAVLGVNFEDGSASQ